MHQFWAKPIDKELDPEAEDYLISTNDQFSYKLAAFYTHSQAIAEQ